MRGYRGMLAKRETRYWEGRKGEKRGYRGVTGMGTGRRIIRKEEKVRGCRGLMAKMENRYLEEKVSGCRAVVAKERKIDLR